MKTRASGWTQVQGLVSSYGVEVRTQKGPKEEMGRRRPVTSEPRRDPRGPRKETALSHADPGLPTCRTETAQSVVLHEGGPSRAWERVLKMGTRLWDGGPGEAEDG